MTKGGTPMAQVDKQQLLLVDLSNRLPYGVKVAIEYSKGKYTRIYDLREIDNDVTSELRQQVTVWNYGFYSSVISYPLIDCRSYLRSMSSMTAEEKEELRQEQIKDEQLFADCIKNHPEMRGLIIPHFAADWCDKNMFDYRGLIPAGLAIEAPEGMYNN